MSLSPTERRRRAMAHFGGRWLLEVCNVCGLPGRYGRCPIGHDDMTVIEVRPSKRWRRRVMRGAV